jgi:hypothetical protein
MLTCSGRPQRNYRRPKRFLDALPAVPTPILHVPPPPLALLPTIRRVTLHVRDLMRTLANKFGILREYHHRPSYDPDTHVSPEDLANFICDAPSDVSVLTHPPPPWPFENMSKFLLMNWANSGSTQKSEAEITRLGREVFSSPDFKVEDLAGFDAHRENRRLDAAMVAMESDTLSPRDGWRELTVSIDVPVPTRGSPSRSFRIPGLHCRSLTQVMKAAWSENIARKFHLSPFKQFHVHPQTKTETRMYDEVYTSDSWIDAHNELQKCPNEPGCRLEKVIAGLMFWSDSTHLTNFGTAKVWPLYLYFANLSKYIRAQPGSGACHHVAYIPSVKHS